MRCAFWKLAVLCGIVLGCSSQGSKTEIVVVVSTDLTVPTEIDAVEVVVTGPPNKTHPLSLPLTGTTQWPLRFSLVPSDNQATWFDVKVTGRLKKVPVVDQETSSSCVPGKRKVVAIFLDRICGVGGCPTIAVPPESLPDYDPSHLPQRADAGIDPAADAPSADVGIDGGGFDGGIGADAKLVEVASLDADTDAPRDLLFDVGETPGLDLSTGTGGTVGMDAGSGGVGGAGGAGGGGGSSTTVVVNCPALTKPINGDVADPSTIPGSTATYTCSSGYALIGKSSVKCLAGGTWSDVAPTCLRDCGPPKPATSGTVSVTSTTLDSTATYACPTGYTPVSTSISCQADGTWSGTAPTCTIVSCPALTDPDHGTVSVTTTTYQSKATYTCSPGYTLKGAAESTCQADGTWSAAPKCPPVDCGSLAALAHGSVTPTPDTTYGSTAIYACSGHYALSGGSLPVQCGPTGQWSGTAPTCEVNCGPPQLPSNGGATIPATGTWQGSTVQYTCYGDLQLSPNGASNTTCQADGTWSNAAVVRICACLVSGWVVTSCPYACPAGTTVEGIKGCGGACWQAATKC